MKRILSLALAVCLLLSLAVVAGAETTIKVGNYSSIDDLRTAYPVGKPGEAYLVNGDIYKWDAVAGEWKYYGDENGPATLEQWHDLFASYKSATCPKCGTFEVAPGFLTVNYDPNATLEANAFANRRMLSAWGEGAKQGKWSLASGSGQLIKGKASETVLNSECGIFPVGLPKDENGDTLATGNFAVKFTCGCGETAINIQGHVIAREIIEPVGIKIDKSKSRRATVAIARSVPERDPYDDSYEGNP